MLMEDSPQQVTRVLGGGIREQTCVKVMKEISCKRTNDLPGENPAEIVFFFKKKK